MPAPPQRTANQTPNFPVASPKLRIKNTGIGGAFMGEAAFRMASLLLEGGGENPGFWRELGAAILSPPTGFNRLAFGDRFDAVFPSHNPAIFIRFGLGVTLSDVVQNDTSARVRNRQGAADYSISYGLPGKPGYEYKRPFDYFHFEFTAVPTARDITDAIDTVEGMTLQLGGVSFVGDGLTTPGWNRDVELPGANPGDGEPEGVRKRAAKKLIGMATIVDKIVAISPMAIVTSMVPALN